MTPLTQQVPASRSLLDIVERASLFALLQQAMAHQRQSQELPARLYGDVGLVAVQRREPDMRLR